MTSSTETPPPDRAPPPALDERWRAAAMAEQDACAPGGAVVLSCPAPLGGGGLGRHLQEIADALGRRGASATLLCEAGCGTPPPPRAGLRAAAGEHAVAALAPLNRLSPAWRIRQVSERFDRWAARRLGNAEQLIGFNGTALAQLRAAREQGFSGSALVSANSHYEQVMDRHRLAHAQYPVERPWPALLLRRNLAEYPRVERLFVSSDYIRDSFLARGFAAERIARFPLTPHPRFSPAERDPSNGAFEIVYVGSLTAHKGVPLLLDAFARLSGADLRLVLVGGWKSRGMRTLIERARAADPRIELAPGDPLPRLARARLCVHPAYEDGFGYAPAEALACGVPVIVSEDTGMKELIDPGARGRSCRRAMSGR